MWYRNQVTGVKKGLGFSMKLPSRYEIQNSIALSDRTYDMIQGVDSHVGRIRRVLIPTAQSGLAVILLDRFVIPDQPDTRMRMPVLLRESSSAIHIVASRVGLRTACGLTHLTNVHHRASSLYLMHNTIATPQSARFKMSTLFSMDRSLHENRKRSYMKHETDFS